MPSPAEILSGLAGIANTWWPIAAAWHVVIGPFLVALIAGWLPTRRWMSLILSAPLASVSLFAWLAGNPFNGAVFATATLVLAAIGQRLPHLSVKRAREPLAALGITVVAFGCFYPHFLENSSISRYLYAAPTGLVPCPTLSISVGFALIFGGLQSRIWSIGLATLGLFYGAYGLLRLDVTLDIGLVGAAAVLLAVGLRIDRTVTDYPDD